MTHMLIPVMCQCERSIVDFPAEENLVCEECKINLRPPLTSEKDRFCVDCHKPAVCKMQWLVGGIAPQKLYCCLTCNPLKGFKIDALVISDL